MRIKELKLVHFRNYLQKKVQFTDQRIIIAGRNGSGKTSLLEAIYFLAFGKSFRAQKESSLIHEGQNSLFCSGQFLTDQDTLREIEISLSPRKNVRIDQEAVSRVSRLIGQVSLTLFCERDIDIIERSPEQRRRLIDSMLSQMDPDYLKALLKYNRVLAQRNQYLKKEQKVFLKLLKRSINTAVRQHFLPQHK